MFAVQEILENAVDKAILGKISQDDLHEMIRLLYEEKSTDTQ